MNKRNTSLTLLSLFVVASTGCDGLFEVDNPTNILDEDLADPALIEALTNTPEGAVSQAYDAAVLWTADFTDEAYTSGSGTFRILVDQGFTDGYNEVIGDFIYNDLAPARWIAEDAAAKLEALVGDPGSHIGVANGNFWGGVARLTLADMFKEVVIDGDQILTPLEGYESAIPRLEKAAQVAAAAGDANLAAGAHGQLARAYRSIYFENGANDLSTLSQAAQHASQALAAKADYNVLVHFEQPGSANGVYSEMNQGRYVNMDASMANLVDPASGKVDPRIEHGPQIDVSPRTGDAIFREEKYLGYGADIPVSRAAEAHLILAEYALLSGDLDQAVDHINMVRPPELGDFASSDADEIRAQLIYERKAEFWLELRRIQDIRHYGIIPPDWADLNKAAGVDRRFDVSQTELDSRN